MARVQTVLFVTLVIETEGHNKHNTIRHTQRQIHWAADSVNDANIGVAIVDSKDHELVRTVFKKLGEPSIEMKRLMVEEFGEDAPPEVAAG